MRNYKLSIDLSDIILELRKSDLNLYEYNQPFTLIFIEADNPDEACYLVLHRLMSLILRQSNQIKSRILCRKVRKHFRIDKIHIL
jgi:hypothetical protein